VLLEVAEAEGIEVDKDELQSETERTMEAMSRFMSESELRKMSSEKLLPNLVGNIMAELRVNKTRERLRTISRGELESPGSAEISGTVTQSQAQAPEIAGSEPEKTTPRPKAKSSRKKKTEKVTTPEEETLPPSQTGEAPGE
jgi:hypothetical protein